MNSSSNERQDKQYKAITMNWTEIITILLGTGIISTFAQLFLTNNLNKRFFRFSNLYKDKLDIIREFYKLLINAERGLSILMIYSQPELQVGQDGNVTEKCKSERKEFTRKTTDMIKTFFNYYEENEIVFEMEIVDCVDQLKEKFEKAENSHSHATMMESGRGSKPWEKAVEAKQNVYDNIVRKDIPELKNKLKTIFQERYKLLETK